MNEKLSENYSHYKINNIPWQFFVLLSKNIVIGFTPQLLQIKKKKR